MKLDVSYMLISNAYDRATEKYHILYKYLSAKQQAEIFKLMNFRKRQLEIGQAKSMVKFIEYMSEL